MAVTQNSFYLQSVTGRWLAASIVLPERMTVSALVLIAPPLAEERKACLPSLTEFARVAASTLNIAVLRFDYSGTGDSEAGFESATLLDWYDEIVRVSEWGTHLCGDVPVFWLGIRTAGALVLAAAEHTGHVPDGFILWDALDGTESLRQWIQRHTVNNMLAYGKSRVSRSEIDENFKAGASVDLDGFMFTSELAFALRGLKFPTSPAGCGFVYSISAQRSSQSLSLWLQSNVAAETVQLKLPPYWNSVGYIDTAELHTATVSRIALALSAVSSTAKVSADEISRTSYKAVQHTCREEIVEISTPRGIVRGILCKPLKDDAYSQRRQILFLGGWSGDRQGAHRLFVQYARRLAACGVTSFRIDYLGRGESDLSHADASIELMADNAAQALDWLTAREHIKDGIDVIAICSGCKVAVTLASKTTSVRNLALWSAETMGALRIGTTNATKTFSALRGYLKKLLKKETWYKILRGQVRTDMVGKALVQHETRSAAEAKCEDDTLKRFKTFKGHIAFIFGGSDSAAPASARAYRTFCAKNGISASFEIIKNAGHSYYATDWTNELFAATDNALDGDSNRHGIDGF